ncbi:hypothetical protein FFLO_07008 [Filobasidium floriforme]|uniref:Uncharacterized protein n=1 Tax=Filobasidium floriforme TaxID=5210 RepID=A0A8K0NK24_9TREE|nr:uncharacterized protein HD553DRAFT_306140 [Filobasidium floriforme]KAG7527363.1 hypothetical protein FFLO_07008 [Filobasidium floriforme]KAH8088332.1 hypothetical protein HD553DRAFT_306140 [Filobasidium floriforme]
MDIPLVFEQTEFSIHVPHVPGNLDPPSDQAERETWVQGLVKSQGERETCFYDEKLIYICKLSYRAGPLVQGDWQTAIGHVCHSVKLTATCSFIPSQPAHRPVTTFSDRRRSVLPLQPTHNHSIDTTTSNSSVGSGLAVNLALPPTTPNPQPGVQQRYAQYANIDGVMVWDGPVSLSSAVPEPILIQDEQSRTMSAYFVAEVPLSFANVDMQHPLLALTCHATLRERDGSNYKPPSNLGLGILPDPNSSDPDAVQEVVVNVLGPEGEDVDLSGQEIVTIEKSQERDLFRGLAGGSGGLPWSRLHGSTSSASTSSSDRQLERTRSARSRSAKTSTTVLRKSFRAILPILSVLTVRMRTLPVACLPPASSSNISSSPSNGDGGLGRDQTLEGDLAATICIEIEAGQLEGKGESFEVEEVKVIAGRQGIDPTATGMDMNAKPRVRLALPTRSSAPQENGDFQGDSRSSSPQEQSSHFPFDVRLHDQHNLIYNVSASSMPNGIPSNGLPMEGGEIGGSWGSRSESVPLRIDVIGRVKRIKEKGRDRSSDKDAEVEMEYVNAAFSSTWNTVIELKTADRKNRTSTFRSISSSLPVNGRPTSIGSTIQGKSQSAMNVPASARMGPGSGKTQGSAPLPFHRDLVVTANIIGENEREFGSFGILSPSSDSSEPDEMRRGSEVACFEVFYVEITVLNASGRTVRLMISSGQSGRGQGAEEVEGVRRLISSGRASTAASASSPGPVVLLEDDVLLPPLLPRSCQATRIQCMALKAGTHPLPTLQLLDHERDLVADLKFDMYIRVTSV